MMIKGADESKTGHLGNEGHYAACCKAACGRGRLQMIASDRQSGASPL